MKKLVLLVLVSLSFLACGGTDAGDDVFAKKPGEGSGGGECAPAKEHEAPTCCGIPEGKLGCGTDSCCICCNGACNPDPDAMTCEGGAS